MAGLNEWSQRNQALHNNQS